MQASRTESAVCATVSRYLWRIVGSRAEPHTAVLVEAGRDHVRAAVDRDVMAAVGQPRPELLGERLEAAVGGRDPARAHDRDAQRFVAHGSAGAPTGRSTSRPNQWITSSSGTRRRRMMSRRHAAPSAVADDIDGTAPSSVAP